MFTFFAILFSMVFAGAALVASIALGLAIFPILLVITVIGAVCFMLFGLVALLF